MCFFPPRASISKKGGNSIKLYHAFYVTKNAWHLGEFPSPHLDFHRVTSSFSLTYYEYFTCICIFHKEQNRFRIPK